MNNSFKTGLLLSYICIASLSAAMITPALPYIQLFFHLHEDNVQWVVSIFLLGYVIGQLIYAPIANRFGRLSALRLGLIINLLGILICISSTYMHSFFALLIGRFITALGAASGLTCTFMLINEMLPPDRAKHAMSLAIVSFTSGIGLAVLIGGIITQHLQWQDCFIALLIHGFLMLILTSQFQETLIDQKSINALVILKQYKAAFSHRALVIFAIVVGFVSFFSYGYSASAPIYAHKILHLNPDQYGFWNIVNMIGMLCSGFAGAYLMKKHHEKLVLIIGFSTVIVGLCMLTIIVYANIHSAFLFFLTTSFLYLTSGLLFPAASYFASNAISDRASASSAMSFINMGSAMLGVIIMGYIPLQSIQAFVLVLVIFFIMALSFSIIHFRKSI